jgi:glycosyltransferase involved in cell wall biosynthesis
LSDNISIKMLSTPLKIAIILPALNEEKAINRLINEIPLAALKKMGYEVEVIVVDNNSTDDTASAARQAGANVLFEPMKGKGRAIKSAFRKINADFFFMMDSDYTYPPSHIIHMIESLKRKDVVIGSRMRGRREKGSMKLTNFCGNILLSRLASILYGSSISDLCTGYWGFRSHVVKNINLDGVFGFELETRLFIQIVKQGFTYEEVPISYRRRIGTRPKLSLTRDGIKIALSLFRHRHDLPRTEKKNGV